MREPRGMKRIRQESEKIQKSQEEGTEYSGFDQMEGRHDGAPSRSPLPSVDEGNIRTPCSQNLLFSFDLMSSSNYLPL